MTFASSALRASGVAEGQVGHYSSQLQGLLDSLRLAIGPREGEEAGRALFQELWQQKPHRYRSGAPFRLHQVLENQLDPRQPAVGNCLGLTLLLNSLAQGLGLKVGAVYLPEAFGHGPHVLSLLYAERGSLDVENILPQGFDYPGHRGSPGRQVWGDEELLADVYTSAGNEALERGQVALAVAELDRALALNPGYRTARHNRAVALLKLGRAVDVEDLA